MKYVRCIAPVVMGALVVIGLVMSQPANAGDLPRVASMSLCSDQLVLLLAEPDQIQSVHWVSQDEADSYLAAEARRYPANYGGAEQIASFKPEIVFAGLHNSP